MRTPTIAAVVILAAAAWLNFSAPASAAPQSGSVTANPPNYNFGGVIVGGGQAVSEAFYVSNNAGASVTVTSVAITPAGSESYTFQSSCPSQLGNGGACEIYVYFLPVSVGVKKYSLTVMTSAGTLSVPLTGTGLPSPMVLNPSSLAFGTAVAGVASKQTATLTNTAAYAVSLSSIHVEGTYSYTQTNNCPSQFAAGSSCTITVTFDPITAGAKNFAIDVVDGFGTQVLPLTGTASASPISVTPSVLAFGTGTVGVAISNTIAVKNVSNSPVTFSSIGISPTGTESYTQTNNCPTTLAGSSSCTIKVTFAPVSPGAKNYSVSVVDNVGTQFVELTGSANPSTMGFDQTQLIFGTQPVGHDTVQSVMLQNEADTAVTISSISILPAGSQSYSQTNDCPKSLGAFGSFCTIQVSFNPASPGTKNYSLTVVDSAGTQSASIKGTGNQASLPDLAYGPPTVLSPGGSNPVSVVTADFNGDGKLDFAVSNNYSTSIAVFLNNGDGTFAAPLVTNVQVQGLELGAIIASDFNKDKKQDLLLSSPEGGADYVLLGNGDGTFTQLSAVPGSVGFQCAAVGDLNGDGNLDYVANENGSLMLFEGNGDGTFKTGVAIEGGITNYTGIALADFNGDKKLDIAALYSANPSPAGLAVLLGNGDGTFQPAITQDVDGYETGGLQAADFNGDGKEDLLFDYAGSADIGYGDGLGHFSVGTEGHGKPALIYPGFILNLGNFIQSQVVDFDNDGKADVIIGGDEWGGANIVLNTGIGTYPFPLNTSMTLPIDPIINGIAVGDFNGDKVPDVVAISGESNQVTVTLSKKPQ